MGCQLLRSGSGASRLLISNGLGDRFRRTWADAWSRNEPGPPQLNRAQVDGSRIGLRLCALTSLFVVLAVLPTDSYAISRPKHLLALVPRPKLTESRPKHILVIVPRARPTGRILALLPRSRSSDPCNPVPVSTPFATPPDALALASMTAMSIDIPAVKQAIELARRGKSREATEIERSVRDPMIKKLIDWVILRSEENGAGFDRYAAFIRDNPAWPSLALLRRRAEGTLWQEKRDQATVRRFLDGKPTSAKGRLALARVLLSEGDRSGVEQQVREVWRSEELSPRLEAETMAAFPNFLTRADHAARMDRRIGAKDFTTAMRAAVRLGASYGSIVKACVAVASKEKKARALLEKVPSEVHHDLGYVLCRIQWLLSNEGVAEATRLMVGASRDAMAWQDTDQWWRERRVLARKLLDLKDVGTAYRIVRDAAPPADEYYRAEAHFMAGWIALRFMNEPTTALAHFAHIDDGATNPTVLARAGYWRGRAAQAAGRVEEARANYAVAARYSTAYYGQLARAKLGLGDVELHEPAQPSRMDSANIAALEVVRAAELLYSIGERNLAMRFVAALGERSDDITALAAIAEVTVDHEDPQATLLIGKAALARGLDLVPYAFPTRGLPQYKPMGPEIDRSIVYAVMRTESGFDPRDVSPADAVGLMQVTPEAGRDTAIRFGLPYDWTRMICDPVYNTQMGAAELAGLMRDYRGSFLLIFAGYNAGRGRVEKWIAQYGDPRHANVDPVDWVERIPFAETRNYVERVMENLQVYRTLFANRGRAEALSHTEMSVQSSR
jgi:soluble lytic murein transglycosylase